MSLATHKVEPTIPDLTLASDSTLILREHFRTDILAQQLVQQGLAMVVDPETGSLIIVNANLWHMLSRGTDLPLLPQDVTQLIHPEDRILFQLALGEAGRKPDGVTVDVRLSLPEAQVTWMQMTLFNLHLPIGGDTSSTTFVRMRDVTENYLLEQVAGPAIVINANSGQTLLNNGARAVFNNDTQALTAAAFMPELVTTLVRELGNTPELVPILQRELEAAYGNDTMQVGDKYYTFHIAVNPESLNLGSTWLNIALTDVTEHIFDRKTMKEQHLMLTEVFNNMPFVVIRNYGMGGAVTMANKGAAEFYNIAGADLLGHREAEWMQLEEYNSMVALDKQALVTGQTVVEEEVSVTSTDNEKILLRITRVPLNESEVMVLAQDVTEHKRQAQQQWELDARRQLEVTVRALLHDIRNPLASIMLRVYLARKQYWGEEQIKIYLKPAFDQAVVISKTLEILRKQVAVMPQATDLLAQMEILENNLNMMIDTLTSVKVSFNNAVDNTLPTIDQGVNSMRDLLDEMGEAVQNVDSEMEMHFAPMPLAQLLEKFRFMGADWSAKADREAKTMVVHMPETVASEETLQVDMARVERVVNNLLSNAVKYTPVGGNITVDICELDEGLQFTVKDSGIGLAPEDVETIFKAFKRGKNVGEIPGTGIGLAVVETIVKAHGWTVTAASEGRGKGAQFTMTIPVGRVGAES